MIRRFRLSNTIAPRLENLGLDLSAILAQARLPANLFQHGKVLLTTEEFFAFYRAIASLNCDPALGLKLASEARAERYDPIAIAALCTRNFRDALERIARYKQLTCPEKIEIKEHGDECSVRFHWLLAHENEPPLLVDLCFAWVVAVVRRGTGQPIAPKRIEFQRAPANGDIYETHFGSRVLFNAAQNVLLFNKKDLDQPFLTSNADLLAMVAPQLESELREQLAQPSNGEQVKGVLKRLLAGQRPAIQHVARELHLSTRTLQRRLTEEGSSFQRLMKEARRELARHYLMHSSLELNETAYLLGYEDANSFFRAFQHWEGTTPSQWRAVHTMSRIEPVTSEATLRSA